MSNKKIQLKDKDGNNVYPEIVKQCILDVVYPVGSIYLIVNNTNPGTLFGGTWQQIKDAFLLSAGDKHTAGDTGGEETHELKVNEMPAHSHDLQAWNKDDSGSLSRWAINNLVWYGNIKGEGKTNYWVGGTTRVGGGQAHNNMPPYITVYVWKRTA